MQSFYRFHRARFVYQETDVSLGRSLADHADVNIADGAKCLAGEFRAAAHLFSDQADQGFVVLPSHVGHALQFLRNRRQRRYRTHQQRQAAA